MEDFGSFVGKDGDNSPIREKDNEYNCEIQQNSFYLKSK